MACGCTKKPGLGNQLLTAAPRPSGAVVDLSYAPGTRSQALPALYGLGADPRAWPGVYGRVIASYRDGSGTRRVSGVRVSMGRRSDVTDANGDFYLDGPYSPGQWGARITSRRGLDLRFTVPMGSPPRPYNYGLLISLTSAIPEAPGSATTIHYAGGADASELSGLGVNAAWHDRDGTQAARKLPSFPVPAAKMAQVGWRTPAGSYALPVNGLGALRFMGPSMGRLSAFAAESQLIIPGEGSPAVSRTRGALPDPSEARATWGAVPARVTAIASVQGAIQYARGSFKSIVKQNPAWGEFYRWPHDLAVWLNTRLGRSPAKADFDHAVGTVKAALTRAEEQVRAARAGAVAQVQPTPPRPQPQVQPVSPVVDPVPPPPGPSPEPGPPVVAQAGMLDFLFESPLMMAGAGLLAVGGIWLATRKK